MKFHPGQCVGTPAALEVLERHGVSYHALLSRHLRGDWGDLDAEDMRANDAACLNGRRILSAYVIQAQRVWIITEAVGDDGRRESTCILLPHEY